ncbi:MAG: hypothetical protein ACTMIK_13445, partial [Galactobacter sp.]
PPTMSTGTASLPEGTGPISNISTSTTTAATAGAGAPTLPDGTGPITTRLASGACFTSPARPFPHEGPDTIASSHYWAGYRAGTAAAEAVMTEREEIVRLKEDANYAVSAMLKDLGEKAKKVRTCLADEYAELTRLQAEQEHEASTLQRQREHLDHEAQNLDRLRDTIQTQAQAQASILEEQLDEQLDEQLKDWALSIPAIQIHHSPITAIATGRAATLKLTPPTT